MAKLRGMPTETTNEVRDAVRGSALAVETAAKKRIQGGSKSGRIYEKYNPRRTHQASAPGESPAADVGELAANITTVLDPDGLGANVESRSAKSRALEQGTAKMAARPFLFPAFESLKRRIVQVIGEAVKRANR